MIVYKTILQIIRKNAISLSISFIITLVISSLLGQQLLDSNNISAKMNIAVFDYDKSELSINLTEYLSETSNIISIDSDQTSKDNALYFNEVDYILTIDKGFSEKLTSASSSNELSVQTQPGSYTSTIVDSYINNYLNTYFTYQKSLPDSNINDVLKLTNDNITKSGNIIFDNSYEDNTNRTAIYFFYGLLAYGMFSTIFLCFTTVHITFKNKNIQIRNNCSPVSMRKLSRKVNMACLGVALVVYAVFMALTLYNTRNTFDWTTKYSIFNSLIFLVCVVSFSTLMSNIINNRNAIDGINYIFIMGACFISGVFMPVTYLPDSVLKLASCFPTYWFVQNNTLISERNISDDFIINTLVQLLFTLLFTIINLLLTRNRSKQRL